MKTNISHLVVARALHAWLAFKELLKVTQNGPSNQGTVTVMSAESDLIFKLTSTLSNQMNRILKKNTLKNVFFK